LSQLRTEPLPPRIALIYDEELLAQVPFDELDQRVTAVITPAAGRSVVG
jgi:5-formyltetrahydrofolate cyclo-ligase